MATDEFSRRNLDHLRIEPFREIGDYAPPSTPQTKKPLRPDYVAHATALARALQKALPAIPPRTEDTRLTLMGLKPGALVEVETLAPKGDRQGAAKVPAAFEYPAQDLVVLRTTREDDRSETAVVFVPDAARPALMARLAAYGSDKPTNQDRKHVDQFEKIETFNTAAVDTLFASSEDLASPEAVWWEIWARKPSVEGLATGLRNAGWDVHADRLKFPDVEVLFVHGVARALGALLERTPGAVVEVRRSIDTIEPFLDLRTGHVDQHDFVADLEGRLVAAPADAPAICILDTGVTGAHPLVAPGLARAFAVDDRWKTDDHAPHGGHGTGLASLALYGDLFFVMGGAGAAPLTHWVESVKFLPPRGFPANAVHSYGAITQSAISLIESEAPGQRRSFCVASSTDRNPPTRPSSWSGAIDQAAAGAMTGERDLYASAAETPKRLILIAGGNMGAGTRAAVDAGARIEDPAQAWNALTIGGFTAKTQTPLMSGLTAVAPANTVSPFSTDTVGLPSDLLPLKPEVLFEAGNMAENILGDCDWHDSLSLLAASSDVQKAPLAPFWATSAAVGMGGNFLGRLKAALPGLWPETYRALMAHSATWTAPMRSLFIGSGASWRSRLSKSDVQTRLRRVGFGVPNLDRALHSAKNDFTLIAESTIQPYAVGKSGVVFNEVHFYDLPWPHAILEEMGDDPVTLRVTLSYFIEPNLSGKAATRPETYRSFGLRFDVKKRTETEDEFRRRLSTFEGEDEGPSDDDPEESEEGGGKTKAAASRWLIGPQAVSAGSLHCDIWRGRASELATHDMIAIRPVTGWWKTHTGQKRFTDEGRYALVLSVDAEGRPIDLHSEVNAQVIEQEARILAGAVNVPIK
jgi:Subtilase family